MGLMKRAPIFFSILGVGLFVFALFFSIQKIQVNHKITQEKIYVPPPKGLTHFVFGYGPLVADLLWIRSLQDFATCENKEKGEPCRNAWLFQMLDRVTDFDPKFRLVYLFGATSLSLWVEDDEGAAALFEKGIVNYPDDWIIPYRGAYHYIYEMKNEVRAAELLKMAGRNGAPNWTFALATRLYTDAGRRDLGEALIQELIDRKEPQILIDRAREKIRKAYPQ